MGSPLCSVGLDALAVGWGCGVGLWGGAVGRLWGGYKVVVGWMWGCRVAVGWVWGCRVAVGRLWSGYRVAVGLLGGYRVAVGL